MLTRSLLSETLVLLFGVSGLFAQNNVTDSREIRKGMEFVYNLDFARSDSIFELLIKQNPTHPQGYYFKASSCFYQIISGYLTDTGEKTFMEWNDKTIAIAEEYERQDPQTGQFYRGTAYGNIARYHAMNGDFIKAFYYAKKSKSLHEVIIDKHQENYDAYLTVGVYNYYAAAMPRWIDAVAGLFGLGGNRALGIQQLETAYEKGDLAKIEAKFFLANVYYEEGDYERSVQFYRELSSMFDTNPFLLNQLGLLHYSMENFTLAETAFRMAIEKVNAHTLSSKMFAGYFLGRICKLKNDYPAALLYLNDAADLGNKRKLFKSIDAWIVGAAYYQAGEVMELSGDRTGAVRYYELAKNHDHTGKSVSQAAKNRLQYGLSEFEIGVMRARHTVIYGQPDEGRKLLAELKPKTIEGNEKFLSQIHFYLGRAELADSNFQNAKDHFLEALRLQSDDGDQKWREPQARFYLGLCYVRLGQKEKAKEELEQVLKNDQYLEAARFKFLTCKLLKGL
jgi:tetratricopeptide (TPR) repeat protein